MVNWCQHEKMWSELDFQFLRQIHTRSTWIIHFDVVVTREGNSAQTELVVINCIFFLSYCFCVTWSLVRLRGKSATCLLSYWYSVLGVRTTGSWSLARLQLEYVYWVFMNTRHWNIPWWVGPLRTVPHLSGIATHRAESKCANCLLWTLLVQQQSMWIAVDCH